MNYEEAVAYIEETPKFTKKNSLDHTRECLRRLGNPQEKFQVIHVAGTNGKGSTCAFMASILREAGFRCGLFTSPHLVEITERFQIDEEEVSRSVFLDAFEKVHALSCQLVEEGSYHPTYFEMLFLMGMVIFADAGVEYVVLETGLGGRLDATTAVERPAACVITSVSLDHMQYLGDTVEKIAGEKAGIIVPGIPVVYDGNDKDAARVIRETAQKLGSPCYEVCQGQTQVHRIDRTGIDFSYESEYYKNRIFSIPFIARYQVMNGALALKTMEVLKEQIPVPMEHILAGLKNMRWQGRMETVLPGVIVDGAHNEDGVARFVETAVHFQEQHELTLLFSAVDDKDYVDMIKRICGSIRLRHVVVTQVGGYRQVKARILGDLFRENGCGSVEEQPDLEKAFDAAYAARGTDGMLFCVGSLYLVGEIKKVIRRKYHD